MAADDVRLLLVGVDGSENSRRALAWAGALAVRLDAEVLAVHAAGLLERLGAEHELTPTRSHREELTEVFESEWCRPLAEVGARSRHMIVDGPPPLAMLRVAEQEPVDLIVVGTRGVGGGPREILGSTALHLVQHATVPVTVLPAPPEG